MEPIAKEIRTSAGITHDKFGMGFRVSLIRAIRPLVFLSGCFLSAPIVGDLQYKERSSGFETPSHVSASSLLTETVQSLPTFPLGSDGSLALHNRLAVL